MPCAPVGVGIDGLGVIYAVVSTGFTVLGVITGFISVGAGLGATSFSLFCDFA